MEIALDFHWRVDINSSLCSILKNKGAFFAEYRKKPGFAGVPSRQP
jgi:hypothetical protein